MVIDLTTFWSGWDVVSGNTQATNQYEFWKGMVMTNGQVLASQYDFFTYHNTTRYEWFRDLQFTYPEVYDEYTFYRNTSDNRIYDYKTFYEFGGQYLVPMVITPTPTPTFTPTPSITPTITPTATETPTPTPTSTQTPTPTFTPTPSITPTITPTATETPTPTGTPTQTPEPTLTPTQTPTNTSTPTGTPTQTPTSTPTPTPTPSSGPVVSGDIINYYTTITFNSLTAIEDKYSSTLTIKS